MTKRGLTIFFTVAFGLPWCAWGFLWLTGLYQQKALYGLVTLLAMWMPGLGAILAQKLTQGSWSYTLKPGLKQQFRTYVQTWLGLLGLSIAGAMLYFLIFRGDFDPSRSGVDSAMQMNMLLAIVAGPFINTPITLGEELGWRGYLYPLLKGRLGQIRSDLLTGLIWGIWHAPILLLGHNYGVGNWGYPLTNIAMMLLFCLVTQVLIRYWLDRAGTIWIAALAHGTINASTNFGMLFLSGQADPNRLLLGPSLAGLIGLLPSLVLALLIYRKEHSHEPRGYL